VSSLACHPHAPMLPRLFASPHLASPLASRLPVCKLLTVSPFALSAPPGASGMRRWPGSWPRAARCSRHFSKRPCSPHSTRRSPFSRTAERRLQREPPRRGSTC
jgi:hypothetical protein